jgi:adenylate cyclase
MISKQLFDSIKVKRVVFVLFFFHQFYAIAQDQKIADSLVAIYKKNTLSKVDKMELLRNLAFNETNNLELSMQYAEELIALSKKEKNYLYLYRGYSQKGNKHNISGDFNKALDSYFKSIDAAIKANFVTGEGMSYTCIADVYSNIGNSKNAELYYEKSIQILRETTDSNS